MPSTYLPYISGIEFGTQYLTKEVAFFLGNIFSSNESIRNSGRLFWIAPVRYNYGYASELQIEQHLEFIKGMLDSFLDHGAISQAQHDKSLHDLTEKMGEHE